MTEIRAELWEEIAEARRIEIERLKRELEKCSLACWCARGPRSWLSWARIRSAASAWVIFLRSFGTSWMSPRSVDWSETYEQITGSPLRVRITPHEHRPQVIEVSDRLDRQALGTFEFDSFMDGYHIVRRDHSWYRTMYARYPAYLALRARLAMVTALVWLIRRIDV